MIVRAPVIVTMNGPPVINGAAEIEGDQILQVSRSSELAPSPGDEEIISLDGCVLLPGLINSHCHLDYTCLRQKIPPQNSFADWIRAINAEKAKLTEGDYLRSIADGIGEAQRFGTTSIVNLEAFPGLIARCHSERLHLWWCAELIDITLPGKSAELIAAAMHSLPGNRIGLAPHAPYTASAEMYRECQRLASSENLVLTTHLAESREEMEMFRDGAGPLFDFLRGLGRDMSDCNGVTPVEVFLQHQPKSDANRAAPVGEADSFPCNAVSSGAGCNWIIAHLNELAERDFELLKSLPEKFSIAHCPRSHAYFQHSPFAFQPLRNLGFNICLATDSLASNTDLSLFAEMREFRKSHPALGADELLRMVTINPASAINQADRLGKIAPGYWADMIALPLAGLAAVFEQIVAFEGKKVPWLMMGGKIL